MAYPTVAARDFVPAIGMAGTGVPVVAMDGPAGRMGLTVSAVSPVSARPLVYCNRAFRRRTNHEGT